MLVARDDGVPLPAQVALGGQLRAQLPRVALEVVDPGGAPARPPLPRPQSDENFDETGSVGEAWAAAVRDGARSPPVGALRG